MIAILLSNASVSILSLITYIHVGKTSSYCVAYMDVGKGREQDAEALKLSATAPCVDLPPASLQSLPIAGY